jgi:hypothetical protein
MNDPTAMTEPLTTGQRLVADWQAELIAEPCELAAAIDRELAALRAQAQGEPTPEQINAAAEVMWNDRDARMGGPWPSRDSNEVCVVQTKATARAALTAAGIAAPPAPSDAGMRERCAKVAREFGEHHERNIKSEGDVLLATVANAAEDIAQLIEALPASGEADAAAGFCEWLKGYFNGVAGRDELTAFEANTIRAELTERVFPVAPPTPQP